MTCSVVVPSLCHYHALHGISWSFLGTSAFPSNPNVLLVRVQVYDRSEERKDSDWEKVRLIGRYVI